MAYKLDTAHRTGVRSDGLGGIVQTAPTRKVEQRTPVAVKAVKVAPIRKTYALLGVEGGELQLTAGEYTQYRLLVVRFPSKSVYPFRMDDGTLQFSIY